VRASRGGPVAVDVGDPESVERMLRAVGEVDAVVCAAAHARLVPLAELTDERFAAGLRDKLVGQATLVTRSVPYLRDGGSVTITAGTFGGHLAGGGVGALVNEGLKGFVRAVAPELPRGIRVNVVSPGWVRETLDSDDSTPAADVARAYVECVEGRMSGRNVVPGGG
jgi:NAD(P)-dependent dehydrogenase (short-subunit alcohol dehydrogenase family)